MSIKLISRRDKSEKRVQSSKVGPCGLYLQEETHVFVMLLSLLENLTLKSSHCVRIFFEKMMKWVYVHWTTLFELEKDVLDIKWKHSFASHYVSNQVINMPNFI